MTRIPAHTIADAPEASRPLLAGVVQFSPTGKLLNLHAQMAHSPAVLAAYAEVSRLRNGHLLGDDTVDSLVRVVREAAARGGQVSDPTWQQATAGGWTSQELAEAFAYLALTIFTANFLNYAQTPADLPVGGPATSEWG